MALALAKFARIPSMRLGMLSFGNSYNKVPLVTALRTTTSDYCMSKIGNREIVGYGWNGCPCYADRLDYPMPAIRFREPTREVCMLREKERCDWKKMSNEEKKALYRYSFCSTFEEMKAPTPEWKFVIGMGFWSCAIGTLMTLSYFYFLYGPLPDTFEEPRRQAQLKRIIAMEVNPVEGLTSHWDYENKRWIKKPKWG